MVLDHHIVYGTIAFDIVLIVCVDILLYLSSWYLVVPDNNSLRFLYRLDDGTIRMYYTGQGVDGSTAIGVAKLLSYDTNAVWVREQASITFATVAD